MLFQDVPSEVMDQVFVMLPKATTKQCILVCKSWHSTALRVYYSNITLTRTNIEKFISTHLTKSNRHHHNISAWVRHLRFDFKAYPASPSKQDFIVLITHLTNLKTIDMQSLSDNSAIWCLDKIRLAIKKLKCLEEIKVNENISKEGRNLHFQTAYAYRKTITRLHLNYLRASYTMDEDKTGNYLVFLPHFKNLTHLSVFNDLLTGDRYMVIYTLLDMCPKLVEFKLHTIRHFPDASQPKLLSLIDDDLLEARKLQAPLKKKNINLKSLIFHIRELDDVYMRYVILYTRLDTFKLYMTDCNFYDWLITKQVIVNQFAKYLSSVKDIEITAYTPGSSRRLQRRLMQEQHRLQRLQVQQHGDLLVPTTITDDDDRAQRHWEFLSDVIGSRKLHCHMYLSISGYEDYQNFKMKIVDNKSIDLSYGLRPEHPHNNLILFLTHQEEGIECIGPSIINSLEIGDAVRYTIKDCLEAMEYAFINCPNLEFFILNRGELCYRVESISHPYNTEFDKFKMKSGEGRKYLEDMNGVVRDTTLNHVSISNAIISETLMQVICTYLPQTKVLKLTRCTIPKNTNDTTVINLKNILHLHYFELEIMHIVAQPLGPLFITIEMSNDNTFYYQQSQTNGDFIHVTFDHLSAHQNNAALVKIQCNTINKVDIVTSLSLKTSNLRLNTSELS